MDAIMKEKSDEMIQSSPYIPITFPSDEDVHNFLRLIHKDEFRYDNLNKRIFIRKEENMYYIFSTNKTHDEIIELVEVLEVQPDMRIWNHPKITTIREFPFDDYDDLFINYLNETYKNEYTLGDLDGKYCVKAENTDIDTTLQNHYVFEVKNGKLDLIEIIKYYDASIDNDDVF